MNFDAHAWSAMDRAQRRRWLGARGLSGVHEALADCPDGLWGSAEHAHPVSALLELGLLEQALEAIEDGATPFGAGHPRGSPLGWCLRSLGADAGKASLAQAFLPILWARARPFLFPGPAFVGDDLASHALSTLALEAYSAGSFCLARAAGLPLEKSWLDPFDDEEHPWARPFFLCNGRVEDLKFLLAEGLDLKTPFPSADGALLSPWLWLNDEMLDAPRRAASLLSVGNDPRAAVGDRFPLDILRQEGCCEKLLPTIHALLLALDEREALAGVARSPLHPRDWGLL